MAPNSTSEIATIVVRTGLSMLVSEILTTPTPRLKLLCRHRVDPWTMVGRLQILTPAGPVVLMCDRDRNSVRIPVDCATGKGRRYLGALTALRTHGSPGVVMALEIVRLVSDVSASVQRVWDWHTRPGALQRLIPPWEPIRVLKRNDGVEEGNRTTVRLGTSPIAVDWVSEHLAPEPYRSFADFQVKGPFGTWRHRHLFLPTGASTCQMEDRIEYELPCEPLGALVAGRYLRERIERGIAYRHRVVRRDLTLHGRVGLASGQRVGITGASGLIGSELSHVLTTGGHEPIAFARPASGTLEPASLEGLKAVVHLAGEPIDAGKWTSERRRRIRDSRVEGTRILSEALAGLDAPPDVLICASAIGYYGNRGDEILDEQSPVGEGFLAGVVGDWERAAEPARAAGIRVVHLRFGVVLWP
ncbi:MAG: hypothetical protein E4H28_02435, partial [Gemmatimonadales bacterium]